MLIYTVILGIVFFVAGFLCGRYDLIRIRPLDELLDKISSRHRNHFRRDDER